MRVYPLGFVALCTNENRAGGRVFAGRRASSEAKCTRFVMKGLAEMAKIRRQVKWMVAGTCALPELAASPRPCHH
jgi:hypothetical protein